MYIFCKTLLKLIKLLLYITMEKLLLDVGSHSILKGAKKVELFNEINGTIPKQILFETRISGLYT